MRISDWSSDVCSSDLAFDAGNLVECHVEAVAAELAMLNFLKLFAQLVIGLWPDRLLEFGEDHGVLARRDRKSTRRTPVTNAHLVCRLLLEKKNKPLTRTSTPPSELMSLPQLYADYITTPTILTPT